MCVCACTHTHITTTTSKSENNLQTTSFHHMGLKIRSKYVWPLSHISSSPGLSQNTYKTLDVFILLI